MMVIRSYVTPTWVATVAWPLSDCPHPRDRIDQETLTCAVCGLVGTDVSDRFATRLPPAQPPPAEEPG